MKKNKIIVLGLLGFMLVLCFTFVSCDSSGNDETDVRIFPEVLLGEWSRPHGSDTLSVRFYNSENTDEWNPVPHGRFNFGSVPGAFLVIDISGNSYILSSTHPEGGRYSQNLSFTATIGSDGNLTISSAIEIPFGENIVSSFDGTGTTANDINGIYTKK